MIDQLQDYFLWGCAVTEVELDLLTGEKKVKKGECRYLETSISKVSGCPRQGYGVPRKGKGSGWSGQVRLG